ncbi:MAG: hypothetical protein R3F17_04805 [Planctomycetota bacterium]
MVLRSAREVWIAGVDGIGYLPFELLDWGNGVPLGIDFEVGYLPSLPGAVALAALRLDPFARQRGNGFGLPGSRGCRN